MQSMKREGLEYQPCSHPSAHQAQKAECRAWCYSTNTARGSSVICDALQFSTSLWDRFTDDNAFSLPYTTLLLISHQVMSDSAIAWTTAQQTTLSFTISWSLPKFKSIASVMPFNHLILSCSLLLLPSIFPSIRVFSNESVLLHQVAKVLELQLQHQSFQ